MAIVYYICPVLAPEDGTPGPPGGVVWLVPPKPQRAKTFDMSGFSFVVDIPVSPATGLTLKPWCVVAVEATEAVHADLAKDPDHAPILPSATDKQRVRDLLASHGEANPPDTPQASLDRLWGEPGHLIVNLRAG